MIQNGGYWKENIVKKMTREQIIRGREQSREKLIEKINSNKKKQKKQQKLPSRS